MAGTPAIAANARQAHELAARQRRDRFLADYLNRDLDERRPEFIDRWGLGQSTFWLWMQRPEFRAAIELADEQRRFQILPAERQLRDLMQAMIDRGMMGDARAARLVFEACRIIARGPAIDIQQVTNVLVERAREVEAEPQTIEAVFEVLDEQHAKLERYRTLIEAERTGRIPGAETPDADE